MLDFSPFLLSYLPLRQAQHSALCGWMSLSLSFRVRGPDLQRVVFEIRHRGQLVHRGTRNDHREIRRA